MNQHMNRNSKIFAIIVVVIVVAILAAIWASSTFFFTRLPFTRRVPPPGENPLDLEFFYTAEAVVTTVNVTLSLILLVLYLNIYRKTRSDFTIGLIIFSAVFFLNALFSSPFVPFAFGFRPYGLGPFALVPGLFTFAALIVLLYLSLRY